MAPITVIVFYPLTQVGKRRGGVFLKTGVVAKKQKNTTEVSEVLFYFCLLSELQLPRWHCVSVLSLPYRLNLTRVMPGLSIWPRSKNTKPINAVTTIRQGRWSSSFETVDIRTLSEPWSSPECPYPLVHRHCLFLVFLYCLCITLYMSKKAFSKFIITKYPHMLSLG